jgi:hypothetical protein
MTLGAWIFLSVVLILVVLNKPFRKFFLWAAAISVVFCGLFFGYMWIKAWRERREQAREAAIQQKKQDDCTARLNKASSLNPDSSAYVMQKLANEDLCRSNPDATVQQAISVLGKPQAPKLDFSKAQPIGEVSAKLSHHKTIEGTIKSDVVVYAESLPGGPGGQLLGKVEKDTHVQVIRLDGIYQNVLIKTPSGITGWVSSSDVDY